MKKFMVYAQTALCAIAMFMAINSIGTMCLGRYYQPEEPAELLNYKK